jgi:hypothetical protein
MAGAASPENGEMSRLRAREEMEFFSDCRDNVRLDLKKLDFGAVGVFFSMGSINSSSSESDWGTRGWSKVESSAAGRDRDFSFFRLESDLLLRSEPGVGGLPTDRTERSSEVSDGIESLEADRELR